MIVDSNVPHNVPAISTSEDSNDVKQSAAAPDGSGARRETETDKNDNDETRDMACEETRVLTEKPAVQDRDDADVSAQKEVKEVVNHSDATELEDVTEAEPGFLADTLPLAPLDDHALEEEKESPVKKAASFPKESLLPLSSFDHGDGQPWSRMKDDAEKPASKPGHRRSPATTQFPLSSPKASRSEYADDEASFNLFNQSFDTMSDTATYLRELHHTESNRASDAGMASPNNNNMHYHRRDTLHMDISLPALGHAEYGDISPIKYDKDQRHYGVMEPIPVHFPRDDEPAMHVGRNVSNPFFVLRCARKAFANCTFLLPCLSESNPCAVNMSQSGSFHLYQGRDNLAYYESTLSSQDIIIATRRIGAAICAFGGSIKPQHILKSKNASMNASIFRPKGDSLEEGAGKSVARQAYENRLSRRYFLSTSHITWQVEEDPPIEDDHQQSRNNILANMNTSSESYSALGASKSSLVGMGHLTLSHDKSKRASRNTPSPTYSVVAMTSNGNEPPRMKYRCKLCGQPKQNHNCPYQQSLQRSIGITVHRAVNAYTAVEPGMLAPALSAMNNFVTYDSDHGGEPAAKTPSVRASIKSRNLHTSITPETFTAGVLLSPQSTLSTRTPSPESTSPMETQAEERGRTSLKRNHSEMEQESAGVPKSPFVHSLPLRPEQYRAVTPLKTAEPIGAYQYPTIPLTFAERRKLSDTVFALSRGIPHLTEECASILNQARQREMWDLAVAEILTQLVVAFYCHEGDGRLDGLQHYLLHLGISC